MKTNPVDVFRRCSDLRGAPVAVISYKHACKLVRKDEATWCNHATGVRLTEDLIPALRGASANIGPAMIERYAAESKSARALVDAAWGTDQWSTTSKPTAASPDQLAIG